MIFLSLMFMPDINGFELLKSLREAGVETATIFTTSLESIENISRAFNEEYSQH